MKIICLTLVMVIAIIQYSYSATATIDEESTGTGINRQLYCTVNCITCVLICLDVAERSVDEMNIIVNTKDDCTGEKGDKGEPGQQGPPGLSGEGAVYTRWGRTVCPNTTGTELVYKGLAAGTSYHQSGGGANYLCTTEEPRTVSY